ncbi:amidohydrolase family protein [Flavisolibacter sp. BT320]|nr:amidohydrolase family protein [Flavisolibacter longurius]
MRIIDAHQHFWKFNPLRDAWITEDMDVIRKDFLPEHLAPVLEANGVEGCVAVQADQSEDETNFLLQLAEEADMIKGVVGWVDLQLDTIKERLERFSLHKKLKGFRHILQGETKRDLMLQPAFQNGIGLLNKYNFTYDILIFPDQLPYTKELVTAFPDQRFVIDHIAKPPIKKGEREVWEKNLAAVAERENVWCKISGLVTEADWVSWKKEDFRPYLDTVVNVFGPDRLLFGSDWPVCLLAASYEEVLSIVTDYFSPFPENEKQLIFLKMPYAFIS